MTPADPVQNDTPAPLWEQHNDSCECHIGICADCGCTNEARAASQERPDIGEAQASEFQVGYEAGVRATRTQRTPIGVERQTAIEHVIGVWANRHVKPEWMSLMDRAVKRLSGSVGECKRFRHDEHCADEHWKG